MIDLNRVVDDQIHGADGVDFRRIRAELLNSVSHCGEINHRGDAGEVLKKEIFKTDYLDFQKFVRPLFLTAYSPHCPSIYEPFHMHSTFIACETHASKL